MSCSPQAFERNRGQSPSFFSIYSADRLDFVPAGELRVGETLRNLDGDVRIESIEQLGTEERVYNLEIHGEHVFRVASSGLLVHNSSGAEGPK